MPSLSAPEMRTPPLRGDATRYNGLPETFIATATAALECGAMRYAAGVIDNQFSFYVRDDGMVRRPRRSCICTHATAARLQVQCMHATVVAPRGGAAG